MQKKIRVAFIYKKSNIFLSLKHFDTTYYHFFMDALKRNSRINVTYFPSDNEFNTNQLKGEFDIILLYENWNYNVPDKLIGIDNIGIPVIARETATIYDCIYHNETGYIVRDKQSFAKKIIQVLSDKKLFLTLRSNSKLNNLIICWEDVVKDFMRKINESTFYR